MIKNTRRLDIVIKLLLSKNPKVIADIGADHGHLEYLLLKAEPNIRIIATDISSKSLQKTRVLMEKIGRAESVKTRLGEGLEVVESGEVDVTVIAGIGGMEIINILTRDEYRTNGGVFVIQPVQKSLEVRKYLISHNFFIENDVSVFEKGKYYDTMLVSHRPQLNQNLSKSELFFGKDNVCNPNMEFIERIVRMKSRLEKIGKFRNDEESEILSEIYKTLENWERKQ